MKFGYIWPSRLQPQFGRIKPSRLQPNSV